MFNTFFNSISSNLGVSVDQIRYISAVLLTYPLAFVYYQFTPSKNYTLKHLYSIISTLFLFNFIHDQWKGLFHFLLTCFISYGILLNFKPSLASKLVFAWAMLHMSYVHILRQFYQNGIVEMDFSGPQMVWTIKLTMLAFNFYDGQLDPSQLSEYQLTRRITRLPSFIEFMGYLLYFGGFFIGPAFEYYDYDRFIKAEPFKHKKTGRVVMPSTIYPALKCFGASLICSIVPILILPTYNVSVLNSPAFVSKTFLKKFFWLNLIITLERFKYYFAWLLCEGACILSGLGYMGEPGTTDGQFGGITNVRLVNIEAPQNLKMILDNWNIATNLWLKNYIYLRLTPPGTKPTFFAQLATSLTSAVWHGFYPGYYLSFAFAAICSDQARSLRRHLRTFVLQTNSRSLKELYDIVGGLLSLVMLNYLTMPFLVLSFTNSLKVYKSLYYFGHILSLLCFIFFKLGGSKLLGSRKPTKLATKPDLVPTTVNPLIASEFAPKEESNHQEAKKFI